MYFRKSPELSAIWTPIILASAASLLACLIFSPKAYAEGETWKTDWQAHDGDEQFQTQCRVHKSDIKQCIFRVETNTSVASLLSAVSDVAKFTEWAESVSVSKKLPSQEQNAGTVVYTEYSFAGAYDRFAVTRYTTEWYQDESRVRVSFLTIDEPGLSNDLRLIRFPLMAGYWQFQQLENGKTRIEHKSLTLPGGSVQSNLAYFYNVAYLDASYKTIRNLIQFANTESYKTAQIDWSNNTLFPASSSRASTNILARKSTQQSAQSKP